MKQCPKCGSFMTWYMTYAGVWCGWKCACGYNTNQWDNTTTTNRTITKTIRYGERIEE